MNKMIRILLVCFVVVCLFTACGNVPQEQNESTTLQNSTALQETQENTQNTEQTQSTASVQVEGGVSTDRPELENNTTQEQPKKNFFETVVDVVTGWFGGESSKEEEKTETTTPTNPGDQTQGTTEPTYENTDVTEGTEPSVEDSTQAPVEGSVLTYEQYLELSPDERYAYYESFNDPAAFILWFNTAKAEYNNGTAIEIGNGLIDLSP